MKKVEYYLNTTHGLSSGEYPKVSGYVEEVTDSKGNTLTIGYDKRCEGCWRATELNTGLCVSLGAFETRSLCVENVHNNIDTIVEVYNKRIVGNYGRTYIQPFRDYVNANGGCYGR